MIRKHVCPSILAAILIGLPGCRTPRGGEGAQVDAGDHRDETKADQTRWEKATPLHPDVKVETSLGDIVLQLDAEAAPITVINFTDYVRDGFYEGTTFHRVVAKSVIQGGAHLPNMSLKTEGLRPSISSEWPNGLVNRMHTVGMVRRPGIAQSAQSGFYINLDHNLRLDEPRDGLGYTVFGKVVDGFDTIERIRRVRVATHPKYAEGRSAVVPLEPVIIRSMGLLTPFDRPGAEKIALAYRMEDENRLADLISSLEEEAGNKAVTLDSGLVYVDFISGGGAMPVLESQVTVLYEGTFVYGIEFESRLDKPLTIRLDTAIKGWQEALLTMKEGGKRTLIVPPELAYGSGGIPGKIPPDSTLIYAIELLEVE